MKRIVRHVMIDQGYGPAECWVKAKVVDSQMTRDLFDDKKQNEQLLVEIPGGERVWVAFWNEMPNARLSLPRGEQG